MRVLRTFRPDGIFVREPPELDEIIAMGVPIICSPYTQEEIPGVVNVVWDHPAIAQMAAKHLLTCGLEHFAYFGFDDWWWSRRRRDVFCEEIHRTGFHADVYVLPRSRLERTWDRELPHVVRWLRNLPKPVGVMACNDDRGELLVEASRAAGLHVPGQVAVLGVDNDALICDLCSVPLSSVATSVEQAAFDAARVLDRIIQGQEADKPTLWIRPVHVLNRQSTDILASSDKHVLAALRYIRSRASEVLGVQEVADHSGVSRRVLQKRFRRQLGHSIHEEIDRVRLDLVVKRLLRTHMSVSEVAEALSFSDATHLSRFFHRKMGVSPTQYRKKHQS